MRVRKVLRVLPKSARRPPLRRWPLLLRRLPRSLRLQSLVLAANLLPELASHWPRIPDTAMPSQILPHPILSDSPGLRTTSTRIVSLDIFRGLIMVIMALDHTRDFFTNVPFEPETLSRTWPALFFTRWITHFCAPMFFLLAGTGAHLYGHHHTPGELTRFLWPRGLWLI